MSQNKTYECFNCSSSFLYQDSIEKGTSALYAEMYCSLACQEVDLEKLPEKPAFPLDKEVEK